MKKYIITFVIAIFGLSCSSDFLELSPVSVASEDNFFKTANDIETAVTGIYSDFQQVGYYGDFWRYMMEFRSDNIDDVNSGRNAGQDANINKFREVASNSNVQGAWQSMFKTIASANVVLSRMENVEIESGQKSRLQAEARFLRALTYFNMVRLWGDLPLIVDELDPEIIRSTASRNSTNEVYNQIVEDLQFAIANLPAGGNSGRAGKDAANIILAKVYIRQGQFSNAIPLLRTIEMSSLIPLTQVWDIGNELNDEMIFVIRFNANLPGESHVRWYETVETPLVSPNLQQAYVDAGDIVRGPLVEPNNDLGGPPIPLKFQEAPFGGGSFGFDYPVVRRAEAVLLLAESLNEDGYVPDGEAFDLLNLVRDRAGLPALTSTDLADQAAFRDAIFEERRLELALEGHRWFDLQRSGKAVEALSAVGITLQPHQFLYPIPQSEIDAFLDPSRFPQNPGY